MECHPDQLDIAWKTIRKHGFYDSKSLTLVKDLGDAYVFKVELEKEDDEEEYPGNILTNGFGGEKAMSLIVSFMSKTPFRLYLP